MTTETKDEWEHGRRFGMKDVEDLVVFFMNMNIDTHPFSRQVFLRVLCDINRVSFPDAEVEADFDAWVNRTKDKLFLDAVRTSMRATREMTHEP